MNMDKYFMWIHYERLHNHNKAKHNKTVCIFLGIYCRYLEHLLWNWHQVNATRPHWWLISQQLVPSTSSCLNQCWPVYYSILWLASYLGHFHYNDIIMGPMASQITSLMIFSLSRLFRWRSKKTSKLHVTDLCAGNSPVTGEFPTQMASDAENVSIGWRHHVRTELWRKYINEQHKSVLHW